MVTPVLVGHSHAEVIDAAALIAGFPLLHCSLSHGAQAEYGECLHPEVSAQLAEGRAFSVVGRSVHDRIGLLRHPAPVDFVSPDDHDAALIPGAQIVPFAAMQATMRKEMASELKLMDTIKEVAGDRMVHILIQPPLKSPDLLNRFPAWDYGGVEVSPASFRMKLWRIYAAIVREWCAANGVPLIEPPAEGLTEDGFLGEQYFSNATHASVEFGRLWLREMSKWL